MKSFLVSLALLLLLAPASVASAQEVGLCSGPVCGAICDAYEWVASHPWFAWLANNPWVKLGSECPIA